ncbi:hypothetical protein [Parvularcula dongshanensis]|uniref:Lipoprotein n=1 Tax=Parvularcula dongshanensis TaxID=1173995 RepID=A0A840I3J3_9PROT|nr:hypothetical protein [Parvularcula dongshanensis]MBB4659429.1 hypothetical protein [Parvularcula dongshanensis]
MSAGRATILLGELALLAFFLAACVTTGRSPVDDRVTSRFAPPAVTVAFTDPDGLPRSYDVAMRGVLGDTGGPTTGLAVSYVEETLAALLSERLPPAYTGTEPAAVRVEIVNVILPDGTRFTPLSGMKSFAVDLTLTDGQGRVVAETTRPFTVLSDFQRSRFGGSAWKRIGRTDALRAEAIASLAEASADVVAEALTGGATQTGLSGRLVVHEETLPAD